MHVRPERFDHLTAANTRTRALEAGAVAGGAGAVAGWLIPRGPVTTVETLSAVVAALAVGFASGWLMRSRWAMLIAPVAFMLVFELARMRVEGPTVDGIRLDGIYGVIALIGGRGVDALLMLLPMVVGVSYGVVVAKRGQGPSRASHKRQLVGRGVIALASGRIRNSGDDLEQDFMVATWDQRGTGKSYDALEPRSTLTVDQMVDDTLEVADYLRDRFEEQKTYLVGSSWGTTIGVLAVQRSPELFHAYVGTGQMVDQFETDKLMYAESLADAKARGDNDAVDGLRELGGPPYENTLDYPVAIASNPKWMNFEHGEDHNAAAEYPASLFVGEYTLIEQLRGMAAIAETFNVLYPQLKDTDFRVQVPSLDVPVFIVEGRYEAAGRETLARQWFELLSAPSKRYVVFEHSGHNPPFDEPGRFADFMEDVRRNTSERSP